jgi:hypothetical protein
MERSFDIVLTVDNAIVTDQEVQDAISDAISNIVYLRVTHTDYTSED